MSERVCQSVHPPTTPLHSQPVSTPISALNSRARRTLRAQIHPGVGKNLSEMERNHCLLNRWDDIAANPATSLCMRYFYLARQACYVYMNAPLLFAHVFCS